MRAFCLLFLILCLPSCGCVPKTRSYKEQYASVLTSLFPRKRMRCSEYFLVLLVDARHLDYSNNTMFFQTMTKHPRDGSKRCDVGHAWVYLRGEVDGVLVEVEGGLSCERDRSESSYFEGVANYIDYGYANPTPQQKRNRRVETNPIKYLFEVRDDGFFELGSGGHRPTFAAKIDLSEHQFHEVLRFINNYSFSQYSVAERQCCHFVCDVAAAAGLYLGADTTVPIDQHLHLCGEEVILWQDPQYSSITFPTPDRLEKSLVEAVRRGRAEYALSWYYKRHRRPLKETLEYALDAIRQFPHRYARYRAFHSHSRY